MPPVAGISVGCLLALDYPAQARMVGRGRYWRVRGGPVVLGLWLPVVMIAAAAGLFAASEIGAVVEAVVGSGAFWLLRRTIIRRHRARHGHAPPPRLAWREFWSGLRQAPRGRLIIYAVICLWGLAGIIGGLLTFIIKK